MRRIANQKIAHEDLLEQKRNTDRQLQRLNEEVQNLRRREDESRS